MADTIAADPDAESAVLTTLLLHPQHCAEIVGRLEPAHFFVPRYRLLAEKVLTAFSADTDFDLASLQLPEELSLVVRDLFAMPTPSIGLFGRHVETIIEHATRRRIVGVVSDALTEIATADTAPNAILQHATIEVDRLWHGTTDDIDGFGQYDDWALRAYTSTKTSWIVPRMIRARSRTMIVAPEGGSKSTLCRQIAVCAAAGIHPFSGREIVPARVLVVDLENDPETAIDPDTGNIDMASPLGVMYAVEAALDRRHREWDKKNLFVWSRPDGINLRYSHDVDALDRVLRQSNPDLVVFGPIYKSYLKREREDDETLGAALQQTLDRLRIRHDCAWLFEHHAPHGDGTRKFRPFGTSLWLRWPDIGIAMYPEYDDNGEPLNIRVLSRFRGDRFRVEWPKKLQFGTTMPFKALTIGDTQ